MTAACAYLFESGEACGRPAHAIWESLVLGEWPLCRTHHDHAEHARARWPWLNGWGWRLVDAPQSAVEPRSASEPPVAPI